MGAALRFISRSFRRICTCQLLQQQHNEVEPPLQTRPSETICEVESTSTRLDLSKCQLQWNHDNYEPVGKCSVLTIKLIQENGRPYSFKSADTFSCNITNGTNPNDTGLQIQHVVKPLPLEGQTEIQVTFRVKKAGIHLVDLRINDGKVGGRVFTRTYTPGPVDADSTEFEGLLDPFIVTSGVYSMVKVTFKDCYGNMANVSGDLIQLDLRKNCTANENAHYEIAICKEAMVDYYELFINVQEQGNFVGCVNYEGKRVGPPSFGLISLSMSDAEIVEENVEKKRCVCYKAWMNSGRKKKEVYCHISPYGIQVRKHILKWMSKRLYAATISPATKIIFHQEYDAFSLDNGFQEPFPLISPHRDVVGATFFKLVLRSIGGSPTFQSKQKHFYQQLKEYHGLQDREDSVVIEVERKNLIKTSRKALKELSQRDWCKRFFIKFKGESGIDAGGPCREFFELLATTLFSEYFTKLHEDENQQAPVHPNHTKTSKESLKLFKLCGRIVGKCVFESAWGDQHLLNLKLTCSFFGLLLGLKPNYKCLQHDAPDLHNTKIRCILENDVNGHGLIFAIPSENDPSKVIPLTKKRKSTDEVTEDNKIEYCNAYSRYLLQKRVQKQTKAFLKGLNKLVPQSLLIHFTASELELLFCGMDQITYEDMKTHSVEEGASHMLEKTSSWFWGVVQSFTEEERAKLLQFVTGSSRLGLGGFKSLIPRFTITATCTKGGLPTAHTCFNQLLLPDYDSMDQLHTALMTALNEGSEGFYLP